MSKYRSDQENFWAGDFGDEYTARNSADYWISNNTNLFARILSRTKGVKSIIEFGANRGINLRAIRNLFPDTELAAVEINSQAILELEKFKDIKVYPGSIIDFKTDYKRDLSLSKGLLIHINPDLLKEAYAALYNSSSNYICLVEYYNPNPVEVKYREHRNRMFKRDFAGDMLDAYSDLTLIDYGFIYHRDLNFPLDDLTWFLLKKDNNLFDRV